MSNYTPHKNNAYDYSLLWRHNRRDVVLNHQPHGCLLNRLVRRRSKITSKLRVTGRCEGKSPGTGELPAQMASNAENVSIWWRHHVYACTHWGRVTHICGGKLNIIGSDNDLSPERRQAIIWTNDGMLFIGPLGTNFNEILIEVQTFSFEKMRLEMPPGIWRPFCLGLNVLHTHEYSPISRTRCPEPRRSWVEFLQVWPRYWI